MLWVASVTALTLLIIAGLLHSWCRALGAVRAIMSPDRGTGVATARTPPSSPNPTSISAPGRPTAIAAANRRSCRHADHDRNRGGREGRYPLSLCVSVSVSVSMSVSCSASHVRPFAWRPIDHGQSYYVLGPSTEADAPGGDAEAFTCSIVCSRSDAGAKCIGFD